jgi:nitroimidazol reductase NimA-like FMN-containing flavoprotein (pyridoxamine 5'-phosphate oxidase superfamily)
MERTRLTREAHRGSDDRSALDRLLDSEMIGHVGITTDDGPLVLPTLIARADDQLLLHGSVASGWMRRAKKGAGISVAVTRFDGVIVARSSFSSSIRYRSGVLFGTPALVDDEHKRWALTVITDKLIPGRSTEVREPSDREIAQTMVLSLPIEEWSLKISDGWPDDEPEDLDGDAWAGVVLLQHAQGLILGAPDLHPEIRVPDSVRALAQRGPHD